MVEVNPRTTQITIRYWRYVLFLAILALIGLGLLWGLLGTQWGASNPLAEWVRRYLSVINRFRPSAKPEDNLANALRIHGIEKIGEKRYVLFFSATDKNADPVVAVPTTGVTIAVGSTSSSLKPTIIDKVTPIHMMSWTDSVSFSGVMDYSGSMFPEDIANIETYFSNFISGLLMPFSAAIVKFHHQVLETQTLTDSKTSLESAVKQSVPLGAATALYDAMDKGISGIQVRPHLRFLLLTTDGNNNAGMSSLDDVIRRSRNHQVSSIVLGFGWLSVATLKQIADQTDGYYVYVPDSSDLKDKLPKLAKIVNNIQVVEFTPSAELSLPCSAELTVNANGNILKRTR